MASLTALALALVVSSLPLRLHGFAALMRSEQFDSDCATACEFQSCVRKTCNRGGDSGNGTPTCMKAVPVGLSAGFKSMWISDGCADLEAVRWIETKKYYLDKGYYGTSRDLLQKCDSNAITHGRCYLTRNFDDAHNRDWWAGHRMVKWPDVESHNLKYLVMSKAYRDNVEQCAEGQCQVNYCRQDYVTCNKYFFNQQKCIKQQKAMEPDDLPETGFLWVSRDTWFISKVWRYGKTARRFRDTAYNPEQHYCRQDECRYYIKLVEIEKIGCGWSED